MSSASVEQVTLGPCASLAQFSTTLASASSSKLIVFDLVVDGVDRKLRALLDTGASNNFVRSKSLEGSSIVLPSSDSVTSELLVRLADGTQLSVPKSSVTLQYSLEKMKGSDNFLLLDLDERFDIILGLPWCQRHQPIINWTEHSVQFPSIHFEVPFSSCSNTTKENEASLRPVSDGPALKAASPIPISNRFSALEQLDSADVETQESTFTIRPFQQPILGSLPQLTA